MCGGLGWIEAAVLNCYITTFTQFWCGNVWLVWSFEVARRQKQHWAFHPPPHIATICRQSGPVSVLLAAANSEYLVSWGMTIRVGAMCDIIFPAWWMRCFICNGIKVSHFTSSLDWNIAVARQGAAWPLIIVCLLLSEVWHIWVWVSPGGGRKRNMRRVESGDKPIINRNVIGLKWGSCFGEKYHHPVLVCHPHH